MILFVVAVQVIYQDEYSGMCTYHAEFEIDRGMNYDAALRCIEEEVRYVPTSHDILQHVTHAVWCALPCKAILGS